jgi:hypothetical protein
MEGVLLPLLNFLMGRPSRPFAAIWIDGTVLRRVDGAPFRLGGKHDRKFDNRIM